MKILPQENIIYIEADEVKAGILDTSSKPSAIQCAKVIAAGDNVKNVKVGDKILFSSYVVDSIFYEEKWLRFINMEVNGILAVIK